MGSLQRDHEEEGRCRPGAGGQPPDEDSHRRQGGGTKDNRAAPRVGERKTCAGTYTCRLVHIHAVLCTSSP